MRFTVPGVPTAKARHRSVPFRKKNGSLGVTSYADKPTEQYEAFVAMCAVNAGVESNNYTGTALVALDFYFAIPKSRLKRTKEGDYYNQRPDGDNLQKSVMDGLNRVAWYDDSQVHIKHEFKWWTLGQPRVEIEIEYLED